MDEGIRARTAAVLGALPASVVSGFVEDPAFTICDYEPLAGRMFFVPMQMAGRAVVLKRTLRSRPAAFANWVIAHELAHAHLRNGGRFPGEDPEKAADALAEMWGFPKPGA